MGFDLNQAFNNVVAPVASVLAPPLATFLGQGQENQANWDLAQSANQANQASADKSMAFSKQQAEAQMAYQTQMSNTAHQREASDLKAAGLNPILASNQGASSPSGAMGSGAQASNQAPDYRSPSSASAASTIQTAQAVASLVGMANQASLVSAQKQNISAQTAEIQARTGNYGATKGLTEAQTAESTARTGTYGPSAALSTQQTAESAARTKATNLDVDYSLKNNLVKPLVDRFKSYAIPPVRTERGARIDDPNAIDGFNYRGYYKP